MDSIGKECTKLKQVYDECFNQWYSEKFMKGDLTESPCLELFSEYKACVMVSRSFSLSQTHSLLLKRKNWIPF